MIYRAGGAEPRSKCAHRGRADIRLGDQNGREQLPYALRHASAHAARNVVAIADRVSGAAARGQRLLAILVMGADNDFNRPRREVGKFDVKTPPGEPPARLAEPRLTP